MPRPKIAKRRNPDIKETWVHCALARSAWSTLDKSVRETLRSDVGAGTDSRIRGGSERFDYDIVTEEAARKWARIAKVPETELLVNAPPVVSETDGHEPTEVPDYVDSCEGRVAASLGKSEPLSSFLCKTYVEDGASLSLAACAEEIAERLVRNPRTALAKLTVARHHFELPYKVDLPALEAIREIVREIVLLIYDPEEIEALRAPLAAGGAVTLTVPAATATAAEVVMARLDRRAALFAKSGDGRWPRGRGAIPLPAETASGLDYMATFAVRIEEQLFHLTLDPEEEQGTSLALKRKLGDAALAGRNEAKDGRLYCILTLDIAKKFAATFDKCIEPLAKDWPRVRFINLDSDPDRHVEEKTLIWALKDYLHDA